MISPIAVLLISGSMGAGKTTVLGEASGVDNDGRSVTEVAREMLVRAGWL